MAAACARRCRVKPLLTWCAVGLGAYAGTLVRYGLGHFRGGSPPPANLLPVLLANVLGSLVLGALSVFQSRLAPRGAPRLHRVLYAGAASGFCGSLTTFSALNAEAGKLLLAQAAGGDDGLLGFYATNGSRVLDWGAALLTGCVVPLAAVAAGQAAAAAAVEASVAARCRCAHPGDGAAAAAGAACPAATAGAGAGSADGRSPLDREAGGEGPLLMPVDTDAPSPPSARAGAAAPPPSPPPAAAVPRWHAHAEAALVAAYALATAALIAAPVAAGWRRLTLATTLGSAGAYARYRLAMWLNAPRVGPPGGRSGAPAPPRMPYGTLAANWVGTWVLAAVTCAGLAGGPGGGPPPSPLVQDALWALGVGFCGCLSTMSTLALELRRAPSAGGAWAYAGASLAGAQAGWLAITAPWLARRGYGDWSGVG